MNEQISKLSIIIVTWHGDNQLRACLDSLAKVYHDLPEIVVVDNAANSTTKNLVNQFSNATYIGSNINLGFAGGNNLGLQCVTRQFILLLNDDTLIHEDSFSPLIDFLEEHSQVGIVQGTMNVPAMNNGLDDCGVLMTPFGIQRHLHRGEPTTTTKLTPQRVFAVKGAMLMFKREVLNSLNGLLFHSHFHSYYEETDFCHRARNAGWESWFVPTPPIDHFGGMTSSKFKTEDIWARYFRNILWSFAHNFGIFGKLFTLPCFAVAAFIRSPKALISALRMLCQAETPSD